MAEAVTLSRGIARRSGACQGLGLERLHWRPLGILGWGRNQHCSCVLGWGAKLSAVRGRRLAARLGRPYLGLEDGFLRSVGLPIDGVRPFSLVVDDLGIHFDARRPSRLEHLLNGLPVAPLPVPDPAAPALAGLDDPMLLSRAQEAIDAIRRSRLSKYNAAPARRLPPSPRERVLIVDQCVGDGSIAGALAGPERFREMLEAARCEHPHAEILIKGHPASRARGVPGHFGAADQDRRTQLIAEPWNPLQLLEQVDRVYVVSSQMGFEALLAGRPVTCFGVPFYAGWGLTEDRFPAPRPRRALRLEQLFAGAYLLYSRYLDPDSGEPCAAERVIEHLAHQRRWFARNRGHFFAYRIPLWKRRHLRRFLRSPDNRIDFVSRTAAIAAGGKPGRTRVLVWGMRGSPQLEQRCERLGYPIWRLEDGFLRSVRLGSDLSAPASWVVDRRGLYFDPTRPSDLERVLQHGLFSAVELDRARALRQLLVNARLSKYNVGRRDRPIVVATRAGRRVILVPGQVPRDASVRLGTAAVATNAELLARVRRRHPDALILYKPHPDLLRGNRRGDAKRVDPADYDQCLTDIGIASCLELADEVHTLTSLVGFEALLRGLPVHCYGVPFYAGWGLTIDHAPVPRRTRRLALDELVAGVLLRYPRYLNPDTGELTTPEQVVEILRRDLERAPVADRGALLTRPLRVWRPWVGAIWHESARRLADKRQWRSRVGG